MNDSSPLHNNQVPTTVFSGFLGSGKTTIISHLIEELQAQGTQVAYIKNEIGDTDIDTKIMKSKGIATKELLNGCICCTIVGPFAAAVSEIISTYHPDRIIIEASGAADPSAIALMIGSHPQMYRDGVISVVDVANFEGYKDLSVTAQKQTQFTDLVVFNKVEGVPIERKRAVVGYVRELNTHSPIIEAQDGKVPAELVFGLDPSGLDPFLKEHSSEDGHDHTHHIETDNFQAFSIKTTAPLTQANLETLLTSLPKAIFRTKGIFKTPEGDWYSYNGVGTKVTFNKIINKELFTENIFVFIGVGAHHYQAEINTNIHSL